MAPHMREWQHVFLEILIDAGATNRQCRIQSKCSRRAVQRIRQKLERYGGTRLGRVHFGLRRTLNSQMIVALLCRLNEAPNLYLDEMAWYIYDSFGVVVSPRTIAIELRVAGWSRKLVSYILNI